MADKEEFYSFEEALSELRLKEEELKRLVSEGEIRAFREGDTMRLRRTDVESLRAELSGGEVVDLGDVNEEIVFEDDGLDEEAGMATEEISDVDTIIEDDVEDVGEELELEEDEEIVETVAPVRARRTGAADEPETEGAGMRFVLIATSLVLILGIPICYSLATGRVSSIAQGIAGLFGADPAAPQ